MRWVKSPAVEANMRRLGIQFEVETVKTADIDWSEGLRRQARLLGTLKQDYVIQLAEFMLQPDAAFPMIILQRPPGAHAKLWPWSGNHRGAAFVTLAYPDAPTLDAYVTCIKDPLKIDIFPRVVNAWESGPGFGREERIINARYLIEHHSMKVAEAAALFGIKSDDIYKANASENAKALVQEAGISLNGFSKTLLQKLNPLAENRNVFKATAKVLHSHKIGLNEALSVINDVRRGTTELQMLSELGRWEKMFDARAKADRDKAKEERSAKVKSTVKFTLGVRDRFLRNLTGLHKVLDGSDTPEKLQITDPADLALAHRLSTDVVKKLRNILEGKK